MDVFLDGHCPLTFLSLSVNHWGGSWNMDAYVALHVLFYSLSYSLFFNTILALEILKTAERTRDFPLIDYNVLSLSSNNFFGRSRKSRLRFFVSENGIPVAVDEAMRWGHPWKAPGAEQRSRETPRASRCTPCLLETQQKSFILLPIVPDTHR